MTLAERWWISRGDGELIYGDYAFMDAGDFPEPDWTVAEEADHDEPTTYICERWRWISGSRYVRDVRERVFGD